ncbi:MAG: MBOAT family O-acyltransferase [Candidatus Promineifilaceae bacterium]|nr:MBOAT family O-acyltransferase [Candidatus Promineifilaceae bacterium]
MTLDFLVILVLSVGAFLYAALVRGKGRQWALLVGSVIAIYWLQPNLPIRFSAYILQTTTVILTIGTWWLTQLGADNEFQLSNKSENRIAIGIIFLIIIGMAFNRYLNVDLRLTAYRPPPPLSVAAVLATILLMFLVVGRFLGKWNERYVLTAAILIIVVLFVILKFEPLWEGVSYFWRGLTGQDTSLAGVGDLAWLGFSYVAFRLIHTLRDSQTGILPALSLREYVTYVLFTPAYISGPIDRAERFVKDLRQLPQMKAFDSTRFWLGGRRILIGMFKKFVIADSLAQGMSLTPLNALQANSSAGLWVLLYGYTLRLFFDFSGYTDIAIGLGILFGINLPENFDRPYRSTSITQFWQRWHITLSNWVRFYVFTPLSRSLLRRKPRPSPRLIVLVSQLTTMVVIGLWHGITWNFFIWGLWHGLALFVHKQWSDRTRKWHRNLQTQKWPRRGWVFATWFLTFQYVALGWVWFLMPNVSSALRVYSRLFGISSS